MYRSPKTLREIADKSETLMCQWDVIKQFLYGKLDGSIKRGDDLLAVFEEEEMTTFSVEMPDPANIEAWDAFQKLMDQVHDENMKTIDKIGEAYGIDWSYASCIWYLRTRSRWTRELEFKLVDMAKNGEPAPNMNDWPPSE